MGVAMSAEEVAVAGAIAGDRANYSLRRVDRKSKPEFSD
jgi:hypothetical protein